MIAHILDASPSGDLLEFRGEIDIGGAHRLRREVHDKFAGVFEQILKEQLPMDCMAMRLRLQIVLPAQEKVFSAGLSMQMGRTAQGPERGGKLRCRPRFSLVGQGTHLNGERRPMHDVFKTARSERGRGTKGDDSAGLLWAKWELGAQADIEPVQRELGGPKYCYMLLAPAFDEQSMRLR